AILAVEPAQARLGIDRDPGGDVLTADLDEPIEIIRVNAQFPAPAVNLLGCRAGVFEPALVELLDVAIGAGLPGDGRDRVQSETQLAFGLGDAGFALAQRLLGALALVDIVADAVPLDHLSALVARRHTANPVPAIFSFGV